MDARPLYERYVIPALETAKIYTHKKWVAWAYSSLNKSLINNVNNVFGKVEKGLVATGDRFIGEKSILNKLSEELPDLLAVEMEGAAVAQVACQEKKPFLIIRVISDGADDSAAQTFTDFLNDYQNYSWDLVRSLLINYKEAPWSESLNFEN